MDVFLGIILFFILLWYGIKLFFRYIFPWLLTRFVRKQQSRYGNFQQQQGAGFQQKPEGEVRIKKDQAQKSKDDDDFGEYVDFEDLKE